jgi:hypothetical protein
MNRLLGLLLLLVVSAIASNDIVPTYFQRRFKNGSFVDGHRQLVLQTQLADSAHVVQATAELQVTPTVINDGQSVTISWSGILNPTAKDWIALYCPDTQSNTQYTDYFFVDTVSTYTKGFGNVTQPMAVMRGDCEFRYLVNDSYTSVANSSSIRFNQSKPYHLHLSLTGNVDEMRVMWVSNTNTTSGVHFGLEPTALSQFVTGSQWTYQAADMCGPPANTTGFIDPGFMHSVVLTGLKPKTRYYYVASQPGLDNSSVLSFESSPETNADYTFQFVAYADMGIAASAQATADASLYEVTYNKAELIVHPGDISCK